MTDLTHRKEVGVPEEKKSFVPKSFPRNPDPIELAHAVNRYRQAVKVAQYSKTVEVGDGC